MENPEDPTGASGATAGQAWPIILIIDDDASLARSVANYVSRAFPDSATAVHRNDAAEGLYFLITEDVALCIVDLGMPGMSGRDLVARAIAARPELRGRLVVCTGEILQADDPLFTDFGCQRLDKPFELEELRAVVRSAIRG